MWNNFIQEEKKRLYMQELSKFVTWKRKQGTAYPDSKDTFNAFSLPYEKVKCVLIGYRFKTELHENKQIKCCY